ncbi:GNAT family N-acetyltransferase [Georgenia satyanarayanai]|uniref:GNAT family N-acetyltransferase n=1 Tax=Georgenia satyanarayanai TaxID=860221 RepID=UPI0012659A25|nr:GNAT family N-acetyltransferase [Georgenia satyanarayanai]
MRQLTTDRLLLRPWTDDDVDFALDLHSRWEVQRFLGAEPRVVTDRAEAADRVARYRSLDDHPVHGVWLITDRDGGRRHGSLLLKDIPLSGPSLPLLPSGETEIGWHLHPDSWGHGYASEAAAAVLAHALGGGLPRVVAVTYPDNHASQRVAMRIGMEHRGTTERFYNARSELFVAEASVSGSGAPRAGSGA